MVCDDNINLADKNDNCPLVKNSRCLDASGAVVISACDQNNNGMVSDPDRIIRMQVAADAEAAGD